MFYKISVTHVMGYFHENFDTTISCWRYVLRSNLCDKFLSPLICLDIGTENICLKFRGVKNIFWSVKRFNCVLPGYIHDLIRKKLFHIKLCLKHFWMCTSLVWPSCTLTNLPFISTKSHKHRRCHTFSGE